MMVVLSNRQKWLILGVLILIGLFIEGYFQFYEGISVVYSHFFYIPIVLAAIWYGKKAAVLGLFFGIFHVTGVLYATGSLSPDALVRAAMFVIVALIVGTVADMMRKEQNAIVRDATEKALRTRPGIREGLEDLRNRIVSSVNVDRMKKERDVQGLIRALHHPEVNVQYEAAEALGMIGDPAAVLPLIEALTGDPYSGVRWKASEALARIGKPSVEPLIAVLRNPDADVRWKAAIALGDIGDERAVGPLIELLRDEDRFVKSRAAYALSSVGRPAVLPLIQALRTGDGNLRWGAAIALGAIKDPESALPLLQALGDRHENVRTEAAAALVEIGPPVIGPVREFLPGAGVEETREVILLLGEIEGPGSGLLLEDLCKHPEPAIRELAGATREKQKKELNE
jgi:HEAT repeat protein